MRVSLFLIPEPAPLTRTVYAADGAPEDWAFYGGRRVVGELDLTCGNCDRILTRGLFSMRELPNTVFKCPTCGLFNTTRV